jgi:acetylornithine deacetylase/succinyl-diaminopimelate desuccinylase-like protein
MDYEAALEFARAAWSPGGSALEGLSAVIRIPNITSDYDPTFLTNGLVHTAISTARDWIISQGIPGATVRLFDAPGTYPVLLVDVPADRSDVTTAVYGHIDKMPHLDASGWSAGLSATDPVVRDGHLYGRGTADDCYSWYLAITSLKFLISAGLPRSRVLIFIESCEESGEDEFRDFLRDIAPTLPRLDRVFILDGSRGDLGTAWFCTSLRGIVTANLDVRHLARPCHSGMATGIVPSTFRIARGLLDRVEDAATGEIHLPAARVAPPESAAETARAVAERLAGKLAIDLIPGAQLIEGGIERRLIANWWEAGLSITGADGLPPIAKAGNVLRERTALRLSLRIPPTAERFECGRQLKETLETDPPYGAKVVCEILSCCPGWSTRELSNKTKETIAKATQAVFRQPPIYFGAGSSVPISGAFQEFWPDAEVTVTGVAGDESYCHGFDENINLEYAAKWTAMFAGILTGG